MKTLLLFLLAMTAVPTRAVHAQEIAGDWQGTLQPPSGPAKRLALHITEHAANDYTAILYSVDRPPDGFGANALTFHGSDLAFTIDALHVAYSGKLNSDTNSITGIWTDGKPLPLEFQRVTPATAWRHPPASTISFIPVDKDVRLEVIDWGGTGRPLIFLAGLGNTAHIYDNFAPSFTSTNHVYEITRRGFGESSNPPATSANYSADRLGDDVLAVIEALRLNRPVLAGHSIAGEELSSIGTRHPEKISALIYIEAGSSQALWDRASGDPQIDIDELQHQLDQLAVPGGSPQQRKHLLDQLVQTSLPQVQKHLQSQLNDLKSAPDLSPGTPASWPPPVPWSSAAQAITQGMQKYTEIKVPVLAFFANPHNMGPSPDPAAKAKDLAETTARAALFESRIAGAQVIRIPNASHYIFVSNSDAVLTAMRAFLAKFQ